MTCAFFEPGFKAGGPIRSVAQIVDKAPEWVDITLVVRDRDIAERDPYEGLSGKWIPRHRARVFYLNVKSALHWLRLSRALRTSRIDVLYLNSLFEPTFSILPLLAAKIGLLKPRTVLIAPRGELSPGALNLKSRKKRLFIGLCKKVLAGMPAIWHASAELEKQDIAATFPGARVAINPDQTGLPERALEPNPPGPHPRLVYVSRITPKKNLAGALEALRGLSGRVEFDIYGPVEDERYWEICQATIRELPQNVTVRYRGEVSPEEVRATFAGYDAFLFPTLGENFGHVIAESLSASCPVICSDKTPWTGWLESGGGWVADPADERGLGRLVQDVTSMSPEDRAKARLRSGAVFHEWCSTSDKSSIFEAVMGLS